MVHNKLTAHTILIEVQGHVKWRAYTVLCLSELLVFSAVLAELSTQSGNRFSSAIPFSRLDAFCTVRIFCEKARLRFGILYLFDVENDVYLQKNFVYSFGA